MGKEIKASEEALNEEDVKEITCSCMYVPTHKDTLNLEDFRIVGVTPQRFCITYDVEGNPIPEWVSTTRDIIKDFFGKEGLSRVRHYSGSCMVPSHTDYKEIIGDQVNLYKPLLHHPEPGPHSYADILINRIFGDKAYLFWDYLTILFRFPIQALPVLCLVSKENHSGKSTLANLLKDIFAANVGFYGQDDLNSQFNVWVEKLIAVFEEIADTVRALNKIKASSTAQSITINKKYQQQVSFRPFVKIVLLSNNEETFIRANEYDIRYWVVRVPPLRHEDFIPDFDKKLRKEVPAIMHELLTRDIITPCRSRMWFSPEDIATDALEIVRQESRSECAKDILIWAEEVGENFYATLAEIREGIGNRYTLAEIKKALQGELKKTNPQRRYKDRWGNERNGKPYRFLCGEDLPEQLE